MFVEPNDRLNWLHHACFNLRTGEALAAPALDPIARWRVEVTLDKVYVREKLNPVVPFFWSQHYDVVINYVGHAEKSDATIIEGALESHDCSVTYRHGERTLAVATISRDLQSLQAERTLEIDGRV